MNLPLGARHSLSGIRSAFTLVELMVVLMILGILAVAIMPNVIGKTDRAKRTKAESDIAVIEALLDQFYLDMSRYPTTEEGLNVLYYAPEQDQEKWHGPYSKKPISKDPWGHEYVYECPGTHTSLPYEVSSYGRTGKEGGEGEDAPIISWGEALEHEK